MDTDERDSRNEGRTVKKTLFHYTHSDVVDADLLNDRHFHASMRRNADVLKPLTLRWKPANMPY